MMFGKIELNIKVLVVAVALATIIVLLLMPRQPLIWKEVPFRALILTPNLAEELAAKLNKQSFSQIITYGEIAATGGVVRTADLKALSGIPNTLINFQYIVWLSGYSPKQISTTERGVMLFECEQVNGLWIGGFDLIGDNKVVPTVECTRLSQAELPQRFR